MAGVGRGLEQVHTRRYTRFRRSFFLFMSHTELLSQARTNDYYVRSSIYKNNGARLSSNEVNKRLLLPPRNSQFPFGSSLS